MAATFAVLFLSTPPLYASGAWDDAAAEFTGQIAAHMSQDAAMALEVRNRSTLSVSQVAEIARALRAQLRARGLRVTLAERATPKIVITLSENLQGLLWIAEIPRGDGRDVVMAQVNKPKQEAVSAGSEALIIRQTLVFEQEVPILDLAQFAVADIPEPMMLVLDTEKLALYKKQETGWMFQQSLPVKRARPWPRDPRGRLAILGEGAFDAFTPGVECKGTTAPALTVECVESEAGWPVGFSEPESTVAHFVADRNFFDGKVRSGAEETQVPQFFTFAPVIATPVKFRIFANLDGRARMFGKGPQPAAVFEGWGSDIATIRSGCGEGFQVLATRPGDASQPDSIQAYSIRGREAVQASAPVEFRGPVTALWPTQDGTSALAVVNDLTTGMSDAFSISISCGR